MLAHDAPYVATCSVAYPDDIYTKGKKAQQGQSARLHSLHHALSDQLEERAIHVGGGVPERLSPVVSGRYGSVNGGFSAHGGS